MTKKNYMGSVDIVICVHNALDDVQICIESIYSNTTSEFRLIIVNDGSNDETSNYLRKIENSNSDFALIENKGVMGYTKSANIGLKATSSDYVVLMNSDVIVTKNWLSQMLECASLDLKIGMVGPISNAASWQSVPNRFDYKGDWAINVIPKGMKIDEYSLLVKSVSNKDYSRVKLLNGFCTLIKSSVFKKIGYLDEKGFPRGYGEENDFCFRATDAGFNLVIDDYTYIYHAKSKSFGHRTRRELANAGAEVLVHKYGTERIRIATKELKENNKLSSLRKRLSDALKKIKKQEVSKQNINIVFLLPNTGVAGGIHSIFQEVMGMREMKINAKIATWETNRDAYLLNYSEVLHFDEHFFFYNDFEELIEYSGQCHVVVATIYNSVLLLKRIYDRFPNILPAYYIQDYEPFFFEKDTEQWKIAYDSYTLIPEMLLFAKTDWLREVVEEIHSVKVEKVLPSLDNKVYYPQIEINSEKSIVKVVAMVRPSTPRRGAIKTMRVLKRIKDELKERVEINIFGLNEADINHYNLEQDFEYTNWGILTREQVANLLRNSNIFIDLSIYQAFGRTGIEAMASGCATLLPVTGGTNEYATHNWNSILVKTEDEELCYQDLKRLVLDTSFRHKIIENGIKDSSQFSIRRAAISELLLFQNYLIKRESSKIYQKGTKASFADRFYDADGRLHYDLVSFIVVISKGDELRKEFLQNLDKIIRFKDEIIIINNKTSIGNSELLQPYRSKSQIYIYDLPNQLSEVDALNLGVESSNNPYVCIINTHTVFTSNLLKKLLFHFVDPKISAIAPLLNLESNFQNITKFDKSFVKTDSIKLINGKLEKEYSSQLFSAKLISFYILVLRKSVYLRLGGFNSSLSIEFAELEFSWKLSRYGYNLGIALDSYAQLIKNNDLSRKNIKQDKIIEDKQRLHAMLEEYYHEREMPSAYEIWGINNLEFESQSKVSIIIPVFNKAELTKQCIKSIFAYTTITNFEIIIVNNGSTDGTKNYLEQLSKSRTNVRVIWNKQNLGFAKANNQAAEIAKGKYLLLLNNDTVVHSGWLKSLVETIQKKDNIGIVGSKLLYPDGTIQHAGVAIVKDEVNNIEINPWHIGYKSKDEEQFNNIKEMKTVTAACMLIRKDVFFECDGFNEQFWNGFEDVDFCFKVISKNYKILYQPSSVITHFESKSGDERFIKENDNLKLLLKKWAGKITPDIILRSDGSFINYNSASIIIVTYNSEDVISSCIDSLKKTLRKDDEVVIVDNNSRDNTIRVVEKSIKNLPQIKIIKSKKNIGFSAGCNLGIKNLSRPFVVLLNPDTIVTENWLEKMTSALQQEKTAAVGPVSNYAAGKQNIAGYIDQSELNTLNIRTIPQEVENRFSKRAVETKLLIGFCMMIKRSILDKLGMLDEKLFLGNDDLDLSWRFRLNGYKLFVAIDTFIFHEGQVSFKTEKKVHTNKLVQESTDILYEKLVNNYGEENVPKPEELWGINWFTPTNAKFNNKSKLLDKKSLPLSIVIPTFNQWDYTKKTIESIQKFTEKNYEIIIIDNKSTDDTLKNLKSNYPNIKVVSNKNNLGFPKAVNQGILEAKGDYILIANNDIVFTENWVNRMVEIAKQHPEIGIVGPISNSVSGRQFDKNAKYKTIPEMHKYAAKIRKENKGEFFEFPRVAFLCTLIKREVIDKIGGLDERFSPGNFEDDDFCLRAQKAGYKTVIATDVFIHHYGSVSFKADGDDKYAKRLEINRQKFIDKWGGDPEDIWIKNQKPKEREIKYSINSDIFTQHIERSFSNIEENEALLAIENLEIALEHFKTSERKGYENLVLEELLVILGNLYLATSNLEKAKESFEKALNENPNSSTACQGLGEIFQQIEEYEPAKMMFEWAVKNDSKNEIALEKLIEVNQKLGLEPNDFSLSDEV